MFDALPNVDSDIGFQRLAATQADCALAFRFKKAALGPHITTKWKWDEAFQAGVNSARYAEKPFFGIVRNGKPIGVNAPPFDLGPALELLNKNCNKAGGGWRDKSLGVWRLPATQTGFFVHHQK